jgi:endoglucanase
MLAAHMDEIGIIATHIEETGFVRFTSIGGVNPQNLPGSRVRFVEGKQGVIGVEPLKSGDAISLEKCFIDVGFTGKIDHPIQIGDVAGFDREFLDLGDKVVAKALDDRIGVAVAIQSLKAIKDNPNDLYFVFTTQEEVGTRGAETSAYGIDPDLGFSVDVTGWGDTPNQKNLAIYLGKGPAIKIKDSGMISDPRIVRWMTTTAEANHLPYQREVLLGGTTDARAMQLVRAGVPVGCVSIPCRYVHSQSEMVDMNDVENAVKLITAMLSTNVEL